MCPVKYCQRDNLGSHKIDFNSFEKENSEDTLGGDRGKRRDSVRVLF